LAVWGGALGLIGAAVRFIKRENAGIRYVADASYWVYIVHLPILIAMQAAVQPLGLPWFANYPMVVGLTFAIGFVSYELLVRYSWIGANLNGKRERPEKANAQAQLAAAE
jgi:peptidoglycan/LPS O-acetylase OafA/YrhL